MAQMRAVVAGNIEQYRQYLEEQGLTPKDAIYVSSIRQLVGLVNVRVVYVGTWMERSAEELDAIAHMALTRGSRV